MEQQVLFEVANPCVQVCEMDNKGYCKGCLRTRNERDWWYQMTESQKSQVVRLLYLRRQKRQRANQLLLNNPTITDKQVIQETLTLFENDDKL